MRVIHGRKRARRKLLRQLPKGAVGAEIGVWKGEFTRALWSETRPAGLHLIDPWAFQGEFPERMFGGTVARSQADMDAIHDGVAREFGVHDAVTIHRGLSTDALPKFADDSLDWIYIDGNHEFEFVMQDLEMSLAKVKPGGLIAGDDYYWEKTRDYPVRQAVLMFVRDRGLENQLSVYGSQFLIRIPS